MMREYVQDNFWGLSASVLGSYEAAAFLTRLTHRELPTISTWSARRNHRKAVMVAWTLGLALHIARHKVEELIDS